MSDTGKRIAVYTGSFDPFHLGHENIARRASKLFDELIIGIGENPEKQSVFDTPERVAMIAETLADVETVRVTGFRGLTVNFVRESNARILVRGLRALTDIEYEFTMSLTNSSLDPEIETVFLMAESTFSHLSSSLIRQIAAYRGDLAGFVPNRSTNGSKNDSDASRVRANGVSRGSLRRHLRSDPSWSSDSRRTDARSARARRSVFRAGSRASA